MNNEQITKTSDAPTTKEKSEKIFVGQSIVAQLALNEEVDLVGVLYENGRSEDFTIEQWEAVKSDKPYQDGEISLRKFEKLMQKMIELMVKDRITLKDHPFVLQHIGEAIGMNYRRAIAKQFNKDNPENVLLAEIDQILKS